MQLHLHLLVEGGFAQAAVRGAQAEHAREPLQRGASFQTFACACRSTPEAQVDLRGKVDAPLKHLQTEIFQPHTVPKFYFRV